MPEQKNSFRTETTERIGVTYYTDPLCCWSWALEPEWRRFISEYGAYINWHYVMGGMIPDWNSYKDPLNDISRPVQMGALWAEASQVTGVPIDADIWIDNAPSSSYPACIAFKSAWLQSPQAGELFLGYLREAVMVRRMDISRLGVLLELADRFAAEHPGLLDLSAFGASLRGEEGANAFREDLHKTRISRIGRFPTLTMERPGGEGLILTGYRPFESLEKALLHLAPELDQKEKELKM